MQESTDLEQALKNQKNLVGAFISEQHPNGRPIDIFHNGKIYFAKIFISEGVAYAVSGGDTKDKVVKDVVLHNGKSYAKHMDFTHKIRVNEVLPMAAIGEVIICRV